MTSSSNASLSSPPPSSSTALQTSPQTPQRIASNAQSSPLSSIQTPSSLGQTLEPIDSGDSHHNSDGLDGLRSDGDDSMPDQDDNNGSTRRPTRRRSRAEKLQELVATLQRLGWTFEEMVKAWVSLDGQDITINHQRYRSLKRRRRIFKSVARVVKEHDNTPVEDPSAQYTRELDALHQLPAFGRFSVENELDSIDYAAGILGVQSTAPTWFRLMRSLLGNPRQSRQSYPTHDKYTAIDRRLFIMTSIVCFSRAKKRSNTLASCLDVYLVGSGVPRRVIETLSGLGLCHSYHHANGLMRQVAAHAEKELKARAREPRAVVAYDNINFVDRKRTEEAGRASVQRSFTNAMYVVCDDLPPDGLTQDMHNRAVPLRLSDIARSPGVLASDGIGVEITRHLIADALKRLHPAAVKHVFKDSEDFPEFPTIDRLPARKTQYWQFAGIAADEGTIEGTYAIHDNIYQTQLGLKAADTAVVNDDFTRRLFLVHGDQLTAQHIRSVQREQCRASLAYDRRQWMLGIPAWFHIQMNLLFTLVRTHFTAGEEGQSTLHTLTSDIISWGRTNSTRDNVKYHLLEPVVVQGYTSRVAALFYEVLHQRKLLPALREHIGNLEDTEEVLRSLSPASFLDIVDEVQRLAFTGATWVDDDDSVDVDFRTMCRMLQEVELFLTVRKAAKCGDVGMLRRWVDPLVVVFLGASQHNYGREMMQYRWLLSDANDPVLQRAILSSGLVNWVGRADTFKPIDLALEHLNCRCKVDLRSFKNSTHDIELVFQRTALCNTWIRGVRDRIEDVYGEAMSGAHTSATATSDMFFLAWYLYRCNYTSPRPQATAQREKQFSSHNILGIGMSVLEQKANQFNDDRAQQLSSLPGIPTLNADDAQERGFDGFVDIEAFADIVHNGFDAVDTIGLDLTAVVETLDLS